MHSFTKVYVFISGISGQRNRKQKVLDAAFHGKTRSLKQALALTPVGNQRRNPHVRILNTN